MEKAISSKVNDGFDSTESKLLSALKSMNATLSMQSSRIQEQDKMLKDFASRLSGVETYAQASDDDFYYDPDYSEYGDCSYPCKMSGMYQIFLQTLLIKVMSLLKNKIR